MHHSKSVIEMARKAGFDDWDLIGNTGKFNVFAALVREDEREKLQSVYEQMRFDAKMEAFNGLEPTVEAAVIAEREACAKVCDEMRQQANADNASDNYPPTEYHAGRADMAKGCAGLIRARVAAPEDKK